MNSFVIHSQECLQDVYGHNRVQNSIQWDLLNFELMKKSQLQYKEQEDHEERHQQNVEQWDCEEQKLKEQIYVAEQSQEIFEDHFEIFHLDF